MTPEDLAALARRRLTLIHASPPGQPIPPALVAPEGPVEHLRNALAMVRLFLDLGEVMMGAAAGPSVVVPINGLARIQARLEAAIELLQPDKGGNGR